MVMKFKSFLNEATNVCPKSTYDLAHNIEYRQVAIDEYGYGPMNPMEPSTEFWSNKAKMWNIKPDQVKTARCGNCAAFVKTKEMLDCITKGRSEHDDPNEIDSFDATLSKANLGYCNILHFKCAGDRTCDAWICGGAIEDGDL